MTSDIPADASASLFGSTVPPGGVDKKQDLPCILALTVLAHPDLRRVGDRVTLPQLTSGRPVELSRLAPNFGPPTGRRSGPLSDKHLSRKPVTLEPIKETKDGLVVQLGEVKTGLQVDGVEVNGRYAISPQLLESGVTLVLAQRVALLLHPFAAESWGEMPSFGFVGASHAMMQLRRDVHQVAPHSVSVLIQGETGTGKELTARAIHQASPRAVCPMVSVNMGALAPALAAAELFGAVRGGYTGAEKRTGIFERADGGTVFLDEIGEAPEVVQVMLLRTLETMEVQPVGAAQSKKIDVRVLAATDASLGDAIQAEGFRAPLLHRLAGYEVNLPSLRQRRDDIGRLLFHFLKTELDSIGQGHRLAPVGAREKPWIPASLVSRLARYDWPGNVRQLRNFASRMVVGGLDASEDELEALVDRFLQGPRTLFLSSTAASTAISTARPKRRSASKSYRPPHEVSDEELVQVLKRQRWNLKRAALELGISRASLYVLVDRCPGLRRASDLEPEEIRSCHQRHQGDLDAMSDELRISRYALQNRWRQLNA